MFLFFSNRLGCMTSIVVSVVGTVVVILLMKGCRAEKVTSNYQRSSVSASNTLNAGPHGDRQNFSRGPGK